MAPKPVALVLGIKIICKLKDSKHFLKMSNHFCSPVIPQASRAPPASDPPTTTSQNHRMAWKWVVVRTPQVPTPRVLGRQGAGQARILRRLIRPLPAWLPLEAPPSPASTCSSRVPPRRSQSRGRPCRPGGFLTRSSPNTAEDSTAKSRSV